MIIPLQPYFIVEVVAFLTSLWVIGHSQYPRQLKWLIPYLFLTVVLEWVGYYLVQQKIVLSNHFLYNIYVPLSVLFYLYLMQYYINKGRLKQLALGIGSFYLLFVLTGFLFFFSFFQFVTYNFILGGFIISAFSFLYFYELLERTDRVAIYKLPSFWINTGLLLSYLPQTIFYTCFEYFAYIGEEARELHIIFFRLSTLFIFILYGCLIVNFLCLKRKAK
jgi:hypothetical protein